MFLNSREITYHNKVEGLKKEMALRYDFTSRYAFESIDSARLGFLDHRNVANFLKLNGHYSTEAELVAIIRRLDVDAD